MAWTGAGSRRDGGGALSRGTSQTGVRLYNERLVLSLVRHHRAIPKAEIARLTGLSAQTVSVIVRQLESDNLLKRETPQRGKVGQPLVPFTLNPEGAYAIGLKVGRRSADLMLLDLKGRICATLHQPYRFPVPGEIVAFAEGGVKRLIQDLTREQAARIAGLGIAAPFELWNWSEAVGAPPGALDVWRGFDLGAAIGARVDWPVHCCNDATAACAAELLFGIGRTCRDYAYFYAGYFIGGGIVINGSLHLGRSGNAGALGSLLVPLASGGAQQLILRASLSVLEQSLRAAGRDPGILRSSPDDWSTAGPFLESWIDEAAVSLACAAVNTAAVLETQAVIIDGAMPANVRRRLVDAVRSAMPKVMTLGVTPFMIEEGTIGADARALGAASLALFANFIIDRDVLFKDNGAGVSDS
jgi:predicted NBD/HSP70 family sugar kinase/predicted DNA-binding transcriptional regulator